jgi:alkylhydroperoxidase/carboxymuconolactone decarboxylase family protein YurZ
MFEDIEQIRKLRKKYNAEMARSGINTFHELGELEGNALHAGELGQKYKELIALGISINEGCFG